MRLYSSLIRMQCSCPTCSFSCFPFSGLWCACLALIANLQRPGHCGSYLGGAFCSQRLASLNRCTTTRDAHARSDQGFQLRLLLFCIPNSYPAGHLLQGTDAGLKVFVWLNGAQAVIAAMLAYLQLFSALPSHAHPEAISATNLMYLNDAENWILVGAVTLRFFSNPSPARRRFYRILSLLVALWAGSNPRLPRTEARLAQRTARRRGGLPYLPLLGSFALQHKTPTDKSERSSGHGPWDC
jgi:hypothetical protein